MYMCPSQPPRPRGFGMEKTLAKLGIFIGNQSIGTTFSLPFAIKSFQRHAFNYLFEVLRQ